MENSLQDFEYFEPYLLWIFSHNSYCHLRGQTFCAVTGIEIQTDSKFKTGNGFIYSLFSRDFAKSVGFVVIITSLFLSVFSHVKIFLKLRQYQAQVRQHVAHEQANGGGIPMNIERYKKTVCTIAWVQLALVFCYFPLFIYLTVSMATNWYRIGSIIYVCAATVVYFNSTLNPILFCSKIREVRQAVKITVKHIRCFSS